MIKLNPQAANARRCDRGVKGEEVVRVADGRQHTANGNAGTSKRGPDSGPPLLPAPASAVRARPPPTPPQAGHPAVGAPRQGARCTPRQGACVCGCVAARTHTRQQRTTSCSTVLPPGAHPTPLTLTAAPPSPSPVPRSPQVRAGQPSGAAKRTDAQKATAKAFYKQMVVDSEYQVRAGVVQSGAVGARHGLLLHTQRCRRWHATTTHTACVPSLLLGCNRVRTTSSLTGQCVADFLRLRSVLALHRELLLTHGAPSHAVLLCCCCICLQVARRGRVSARRSAGGSVRGLAAGAPPAPACFSSAVRSGGDCSVVPVSTGVTRVSPNTCAAHRQPLQLQPSTRPHDGHGCRVSKRGRLI
jgi:hypothetical protein